MRIDPAPHTQVAPRAPTTAAIAFVAALEQLGVRRAFGLPGVHNLPLWSAMEASPIDLVGVRHEQTAVYAADGQARTTGELGVALTTTGPGAANAIAATGEAWASKSPVLVVATDIPARLRREGVHRGVLHETRDQAAMFAPVVKRTFRVAYPGELVPQLVAAASAAVAAPTGPVYLEVPTDFLEQEVDPAPAAIPSQARARAPEESVHAAAEVLTAAARPLIWAGGGTVRSGARAALVDVAERLGAPVLETYASRGVMPLDHPCRVAFPPHLPSVGALWDEADAVLAVGTDFDGMMTQNWAMPAPARLVSINVLRSEIDKAYPAEVALVGDAAQVLGQLLEVLPANRPASLAGRVSRMRRLAEDELAHEDQTALALLSDLADAIPADTPIAADMCIPGYWVAALREFSQPSRLVYPVGWGTLGFGFPASIGMAFAHGPTVCLCGDGGFLFAAGELAVLAEHRPPLTVLLVDDGGYGMLRYDQQVSGAANYGVDLATPDFVALARAFGLSARRVPAPGEELRNALRESLGSGEPSVLVLEATLTPPVTTSPRWYRRAA